MKATGIVRRIDELGRVVIPKEIRRTMRFNEGTEIEIFTDGEQIIFQRYSTIKSMSAIVKGMLDAIYSRHKMPIIACDMDNVIAAKGVGKEKIVASRITAELEEILKLRGVYTYSAGDDSFCFPVEDVGRFARVCVPVIASGDIVGAIILLSEPNTPELSPTDSEIDLVQTFALYLGEQLSG